MLEQWPISIQHFLIESYGNPTNISKLNGIKAEGGCYRVRFSSYSVIVKQMKKPQEYFFYNNCSSYFQDFKRNIPDLYWSFKDKDYYWIIIEDIPYSLPKERQKGDEHVLEALFHLHTEMWDKKLPSDDYYVPKWEDELTESVLELFQDNKRNQVKNLLLKVQEDSQQLFKPYCWINADTNPTNWGIRKDGTIVLFDWERISSGSPAIDLSITMPGLGTLDNSLEALISKRYLQFWTKASIDFPFSEKELLHQINLAKIWSAVEFLDSSWTTLDFNVLQNILTELEKKLYNIR